MRVSDIRQRRAGQRDGRAVLDVFSLRGQPLDFSINHLLSVDGPHMHNHAYEFVESLILSGGYEHEYFLLRDDGTPGPTVRQEFRAGDVNYMPHALFHRISAVRPGTFTWMCYGPKLPKVREYWVPGKGVVPFREIDARAGR